MRISTLLLTIALLLAFTLSSVAQDTDYFEKVSRIVSDEVISENDGLINDSGVGEFEDGEKYYYLDFEMPSYVSGTLFRSTVNNFQDSFSDVISVNPWKRSENNRNQMEYLCAIKPAENGDGLTGILIKYNTENNTGTINIYSSKSY